MNTLDLFAPASTPTSTVNTADLVARLVEADKAYHDNGKPIMSDAAYDALRDELQRLDPTNAYFTKVGTAPASTGAWQKVKHDVPMGSQFKAQTPDELNTWATKVGTARLTVTEKMDGASLILKYVNGKLILAATRGDGETGEDITRNVKLMQGVVKQLPPGQPALVHVRAEIVVKHGDFNSYFPGESNPRNTAAGTAKRQSDPEKCKFLSVVAYQLLHDREPLPSKTAELNALRSMGFEVVNSTTGVTLADVHKVYNEYVAGRRAALDYDIDGLIVEVDNRDAREGFGVQDGRPKGSIAFKFGHAALPTYLRSIEWQVGKSGRVTPVAVFDPVNFQGVTVTRASLAGVRQVQHLKLSKGCRILVARRNDVIPRVEANLDEGLENDG